MRPTVVHWHRGTCVDKLSSEGSEREREREIGAYQTVYRRARRQLLKAEIKALSCLVRICCVLLYAAVDVYDFW